MLAIALKVIQLLAIRYEREAIQLRQRRDIWHLVYGKAILSITNRPIINVETHLNRTHAQKPPIIDIIYKWNRYAQVASIC